MTSLRRRIPRRPVVHCGRLAFGVPSGIMSGSVDMGKAGPGPATARAKLSGRADETLYYRHFRSEDEDLPHIVRLCEQELSEPYNVYTFRYFLVEWPHLAFLVYPSETSLDAIATIVCKQDRHNRTERGYIGMLSVDRAWRRRGIARRLVELAVAEMARRGAHEVALETEYNNAPSLALYCSLGFLRSKRLHRFYSNGNDAPLGPGMDPLCPPQSDAMDNGDLLDASSDEDRYFVTPLASAVLRGPQGDVSWDTAQEARQVVARSPPPVPPRPAPSYIL